MLKKFARKGKRGILLSHSPAISFLTALRAKNIGELDQHFSGPKSYFEDNIEVEISRVFKFTKNMAIINAYINRPFLFKSQNLHLNGF